MVKYIFQRLLILTFILSLGVGICGLFIPGFFATRYDNVKIIKNTECRHFEIVSGNNCRDLGRYVKFEYKKNNGVKDTDDCFFEYNNEVDKYVKSKNYYKLTNDHIAYVANGWIIAIVVILIVLSGILFFPCCLDEMDVHYDYDEDEREIARFRLKVFCSWRKFIGYSSEKINAFYKDYLNKINSMRYFGRREIPYYSELEREYNNFINNISNSKINVMVKDT